jgi:5-methylcytosine-specific restriction enzyme A
VNYAKRRAQGVCEFCNHVGPFLDADNLPYLEVHHIFRLADDGPDIPGNVAALCPNCHKEAHFGLRHNEIKDRLTDIIRKREMKIGANGL